MPITSRQTGSLAAENWKKVYQTFREADFTSYDFESLRKTMIDYIKLNYAEDFNDFTESSEFIALVDLIAFLGQSLAFRTDLNLRENFIDTAERRDSILKLARLISYNPKRNTAASGFLKIESVSTTETIYDSDGFDLSNRIVIWNDNSNPNWFEQFVSVVNASFLQHQNFGRPNNLQVINGIRTEEYGVNLINNILPIYRFETSVNGLGTSFEAVSMTSSGKQFLYEQAPDINKPFNILYRNDGNGNNSNNTGFFVYFKQGELNNLDFTIDTAQPNKILNIDIDNINNNDIWLYSVDSAGYVDEQWQQVPTTSGLNVIYNTLPTKNLFQVNSRANDQISLVFGDGSFARMPQGKYRLFYRTSNGNTYKITPDEIRGVQVSFDYVSRNNRVETITLSASLRYTVANAKARETADEIRQRAPQQYYTQNRMVTGEDYNIFPYTNFTDIKKVKAINRISSGLSRYLDTLDTTGKYSSTNIFGEDGVLYSEYGRDTIDFSFKNQIDIRKFLRNTFIPEIIDSREVMHYFHDQVAPRLPSENSLGEADIIEGEFYQIMTLGTTDFVQYGASSNEVGTVFQATRSALIKPKYDISFDSTAGFYLNGKNSYYNPTIGPTNGVFGVSTQFITSTTKVVAVTILNAPPAAKFKVTRTYTGPHSNLPETATIELTDVLLTVPITDKNGFYQLYPVFMNIPGEFTYTVEFVDYAGVIVDGNIRTYKLIVAGQLSMPTFPSSPTLSQTFSAFSVNFTWDGVRWMPSLSAAEKGAGTPLAVSATGSGLNPDIRITAGDALTLNVLDETPVYIKSSLITGIVGAVTVGTVVNNGANSGPITWDTTGAPPGTYYYVDSAFTGRCYEWNDFVNEFRGSNSAEVFSPIALKILPLYRSNAEFVLSNGSVRYGLYRNPDRGGLAYWTNQAIDQNLNPASVAFYDIFFGSVDASPSETNRSLNLNKSFDIGNGGGCGFYDKPTDWAANHRAGKIIIESTGTGLVTSSVKWVQSSIGTGVTTGYFAYNGAPIAIGTTQGNENKFINTGALVKFVPPYQYHFNSNFNLLRGPATRPGDSVEKFAAVTQIYGDGTNNGQGAFANGTGPVRINLPIPTGARVESILPTFKSSLREFLIDEMVSKILAYSNFGLIYDSQNQNWVLVPSQLLNIDANWWIKFEWFSGNQRYTITYKNLKFVFHSPKETNFFFDHSLQIYDPVLNRVINDSIKILGNNNTPGSAATQLGNDIDWYVHKEIKRADGYLENRYVYLTYADSNQDGVPDTPNVFDTAVIGGPYRTRVNGLLAQKTAVTINYVFRNEVGRYPSQAELDRYVNQVVAKEIDINSVRSIFNQLPEATEYKNGNITAVDLVFFELVTATSGEYSYYKLIDSNKVISRYKTKTDIAYDVNNYNLGQLFFARNDRQFYTCVSDSSGIKAVSDGLNVDATSAVPKYVCHIGRQNLYYQYRHNSPNTNRIDPSISNIIDLYILTAEYETNYRLWIEDSTGKVLKPDAPTDLELRSKYADLENYKSISDTIVVQSAVYKPLFGSKADPTLQATFKVVKNPGVNITDADIKSSVIATINDFFATENWDFGDSFYFSELAAYLHKMLIPSIASIVITSKNLNMSFGNLYQINSEPYELLVSAATVDDVEIVSSINSLELLPN